MGAVSISWNKEIGHSFLFSSLARKQRLRWLHFLTNPNLNNWGEFPVCGGGRVKRVSFSVLGAILVLVLGCADVWAQATAQISGTARDQSGAVLPGGVTENFVGI